MTSLHTKMNVFKEHLENKCIKKIEKELETFFSSRMKSAYTYSFLAAQNLHSYNCEDFEKMVFSQDELNDLLQNILTEINEEFIENIIDTQLSDSYTNIINIKNVDNIIKDTAKTFQINQKISKTCEMIMNNVFSKTLKSILPNPLTTLVVKKINFGNRFFGEYSYKGQIARQQEHIYKQLEGIIINMKTDTRNELISFTIKNLHYLQNREMLPHYIIA